jgi:hypothetical protein
MTSITDEDFEQLLSEFEQESVHLEMRDAYGTSVELPHMAQWAAGEPDGLQWLTSTCSTTGWSSSFTTQETAWAQTR